MKKLLLLFFGLAILALSAWHMYNRTFAPDAGSSRRDFAGAVAVETRPVQKATIRDIGVFTGSFEPKSQFVVAPKVSGWLRELLVDVGDTVRQNQVIAVLDDEEFTQQLEQARAELAVASANAANCASDLDIARREYERAKALREKQIASASELDVSEAEFNACRTRYKVSLAQVAQKEAILKTAEVRLSYTKVQAFWEQGDQPRVVGERFVDEGTLLQANSPIVSILENDPLRAVVYVIEKDYSKVRIGQHAVVTTDAYSGKTFSGVIVRLAPLLRESSRQARVEVEVPNQQRLLKPGMFVRAQVEFDRHENAALVPFSALVKRNDVQGIFIADPETLKARFVPVTTGIINSELIEIIQPEISGLVITLGNHLLEDDSDIVISKKQLQSLSKKISDPEKASVNTNSGDSR